MTVTKLGLDLQNGVGEFTSPACRVGLPNVLQGCRRVGPLRRRSIG